MRRICLITQWTIIFNYMRVLVTGASGQLGMTFQKSVEGWEHQVIFTDVCPTGNEVESLDVTDREAVSGFLTRENIDVIVNCAGYTDVDKAETDEDAAFKVNAEAVRILAEEAASRDVVLIHISTDYVLDGKSGVQYGEDAEPAPLNAYGRSKLAGELAVLASAGPHMIIRTAWLFSPYGRNFVKTILEKSSQLPELKVVSDQIGNPTYAGDLVDFIMYLIDSGDYRKSGLYNFSNEGVCSWYDLAVAVCQASGNLCDVVPCKTGEYPVKAVRPHFSVLDKSKVKETFGVEIPHWTSSLAFCLSQMDDML